MLAEKQKRELKIGEILSSLRHAVTSPWESRATGEPDFARLGGIAVAGETLALAHGLSGSTGNFPAEIQICADVDSRSSACILITGGLL